MRTKKRWASALVVLAMVLTMFPVLVLGGSRGRVRADGEELPELQNLVISEAGVITWDPVEGVKLFTLWIYINGRNRIQTFVRELENPSYDLYATLASSGYDSCEVEVKIDSSDGAGTQLCRQASVKYDYVAKGPKLEAPKNARWDGNVFRWDYDDDQAQFKVEFTFSEDGGQTWKPANYCRASSNKFYDMGRELVYGTNLYRIRVGAIKYGYPNSDQVEASAEFTFDREIHLTMDELTRFSADYSENVYSYNVTAVQGEKTLINNVAYVPDPLYIYDLLKNKNAEAGPVDVTIVVSRNIGGKLYPVAPAWNITYDFQPWDLRLLGYGTNMSSLANLFGGSLIYDPSQKSVTFRDFDMSDYKDTMLFIPLPEGVIIPLFSCSDDITLKGNAVSEHALPFFECEKTMYIDEGSDLNLTSTNTEVLVADNLIVNGGTLNLKSGAKVAVRTNEMLAFSSKVKTIVAEGKTGEGALVCENGKISIASGLRIARPENGNLGSDAHHVYESDKVTVADLVEITSETPTPTPTKKASPTPTKKASPTPTKKATPTPTKTPTKAPTKAPTLSPTPKPTSRPTVIPTLTPTSKPVPVTPTSTPVPTETPTPSPVPVTPEPTLSPTPSGTPTPTLTPVPEKEPSIADFVERLYTIALNRESEPEGKAFWVKEIEDGNRTGGDCAYFFLIEAPEFKNRGLGDEDFVETLYKTFFDRASEADGKAFWVGQLKKGTMTRDQVIMGFIDSKEWCNVCATYGVKSGAPTAKAEFASKNAINFATRLYTCCLGRDPEEKGLQYWALALTNLEQTGCSAAKEFFKSQEFTNLNLKTEEYIKRLYTTFMDREPEASEVSYWAGEISKGTQTRDSVLAFFGQSEEFTNICKKYGIDRGTI